MQQKIITLELPITATFKTTFPDKQNPNGLIPNNSILDKGFFLGFGLTYSEFRAKRHSLITIPYTPAIEDKYIEHRDMCPLKVYGDFTNKQREEIKTYLLNDEIKYKKIAVTPESFWKVITVAKEIGKEQWLYDEFFCFLDEFHCYACDAFREDILTPFTYFWKFNKKAMGSATPYPFSDPKFKKLDYYKLRFTESLGTVKIVHEEQPLEVLRYLLEHPELFPGKVHIFFGSVTSTGKLINDLGLTDVRAFCRNEESNMENLGEAAKYFRDSIRGADFAKFNFYTGRYNEGCDLRDDSSATMILVTDVNIPNSMVGINYRGVQATGRLRLKAGEQPNQVIHITNTKQVMKTDREKIEENVIYSAKIHIDQFNYFNKRRFQDGMLDILEMDKFVSKVSNITEGRAEICHYKIDQIVYAKSVELQYDNIETVHALWQSCNRKTERAEFGLSKIKQSRRSHESINKDVVAEFIKFKDSPELYLFGKAERDIKMLKDKHSILYQTYMLFGQEEVERLNYNNDEMKAALVEQSNKNQEAQLRLMIAERIKVGEYTKKEIKNILQIIYDSLEIKKLNGKRKIAKAEDLKDLGMFDIEIFKGESDKGTRIDKFRIVRELYKIKRAA
jgi:hypothetical protein